MGLFKAELVSWEGPWRGLEDLEFATLTWIDWSTTPASTPASTIAPQPRSRPRTTVTCTTPPSTCSRRNRPGARPGALQSRVPAARPRHDRDPTDPADPGPGPDSPAPPDGSCCTCPSAGLTGRLRAAVHRRYRTTHYPTLTTTPGAPRARLDTTWKSRSRPAAPTRRTGRYAHDGRGDLGVEARRCDHYPFAALQHVHCRASVSRLRSRAADWRGSTPQPEASALR